MVIRMRFTGARRNRRTHYRGTHCETRAAIQVPAATLESGPIEVLLRHESWQLGRLVLGSRRGDAAYTQHDRDSLQRSADSVGEALALAEHLGHRPSS